MAHHRRDRGRSLGHQDESNRLSQVTIWAPARALGAFKPTASPGLLVSASAIAATFTATPFVIAEATQRFNIGIGTAALLSTAQVAGFTVANLIGNRRFHASASLARLNMAIFAIANLASAFTPWFPLLILLRFVSGSSMGVLTWIAWADSASDGNRRGEIAAVGPLAAAVAAPILGILSSVGGLSAVYGALSVVAAAALLRPTHVAEHEISKIRNPIQTPGVRWVLVAMGFMTGAGSAVFVFARVIAQDNLAMTGFATSIAISLNALAGIPAARFAGRRRFPGVWIGLTGICAFLLTQATTSLQFTAILIVWGLSFWSATPEVFSLLADRSVFPSDRVGDAQAVMSFGRVIGPTAGGLLISGTSFTLLGIVAMIVLLTAGFMAEAVATAHRWRRTPVPAR